MEVVCLYGNRAPALQRHVADDALVAENISTSAARDDAALGLDAPNVEREAKRLAFTLIIVIILRLHLVSIMTNCLSTTTPS